jgi:hypothetical protein
MLPWLFWTPLGLCYFRLDHPGLRRIWTSPKGFCHHGVIHFRGLTPFGAITSNTYSKRGLFNPWGFTFQALPQGACFVGVWPTSIFIPGALPHGPPLPCLGHQAWHPCASTNLVVRLCKNDLKCIVKTRFCATMSLDHISATMTYVIWREAHNWNVSVLQRVHISNHHYCYHHHHHHSS